MRLKCTSRSPSGCGLVAGSGASASSSGSWGLTHAGPDAKNGLVSQAI